LLRTNLIITPAPVRLRWLHDPIDNSVALAISEGTTSELCSSGFRESAFAETKNVPGSRLLLATISSV
jgi:hypothetical protein